jgi:hypothetical protein
LANQDSVCWIASGWCSANSVEKVLVMTWT